MDDTELLRTVTREQLARLCESCRLAATGPKGVLLQRLRDHAAAEAAAARERIRSRNVKVEDGTDDSKERYELVEEGGILDDEEEEGFFFYAAPDAVNGSTASNKATNSNEKNKKKSAPPITSSTVTAPPVPHDLEPDENGERSVTVYSTTDQNDLTAVAAAQPGRGASLDALSSTQQHQQPQPWDMEGQQRTSQTSNRELERARQQIVELVSNLLALSGAPAFAMNLGDDDDDE